VFFLALFSATTLMVTGCGSKGAEEALQSGPIYVSACGYGENQKPDGITLACADGGIYVDGITWSSWGGNSVEGVGIFHRNLCEPSCAEGSYIEVPVKVTISEPILVKKKSMYSQMYLESTNGKNLILGAPTYGTDIVTEGF
jgi:hypothetical protein